MDNFWNPGELLSISSSYWKGCTIQAAVRLEIFTLLGDSSVTPQQLAHLCGTDARATGLLLNALSAMGLLDKKEELFSNTPFAATFLVKTSGSYMGHIILHHHHLVDAWAQLDEAIKTGNPVDTRSYGEEIERESFILGMHNLATVLAASVAEKIDLKGRTTLLDLGGGPGTFAIHFCRANPELHATIFDRETTEPYARKTISTFDLDERIDFTSGDFTNDPLPAGPFDAAWLSHILHSNDAEQCLHILTAVKKILSPGGVLMIHDFILDESMDSPEFGALFSLNMLLNNGVGRSYSLSELTIMLERAGLNNISHLDIESPNGSSIIMGVV